MSRTSTLSGLTMAAPMAGRPAPRAASRYGFGPTGRTLRALPRAKDLHQLLGHERTRRIGKNTHVQTG